MLPSLSQLPNGTTPQQEHARESVKLFNYLKQHRVPKNKECKDVDCPIDGYRMVMRSDAWQTPIQNDWIKLVGTAEEKLHQLQSHPRALEILGPSAKVCKNMVFINFFVEKKRKRNSAPVPTPATYDDLVEQNDFTITLAHQLDYVLLHPSAPGVVFAAHIQNIDDANAHGLTFAGIPYLYVTLICSNAQGLGKHLMSSIFGLAMLINAQYVALDALSHVVFYYYNLGFRFASSVDFTLVELPPDIARRASNKSLARLEPKPSLHFESRETQALVDSVVHGELNRVRYLARQQGANVNVIVDGFPLLVIAAVHDDPHKGLKITRALLEHGANPDAQTRRGETALIFAARQGNAPLAEKLLAAGADRTIRNDDDKDALYFANHFRHAALVDLLTVN